MNSFNQNPEDVQGLIEQLNSDRKWILEKIDQGHWPSLRKDLAALEREMSHMIDRSRDKLKNRTSIDG